MTNIIRFPCQASDIIEHLEFLLTRAREGSITAIAVVDVNLNGTVGSSYFGVGGTYHQLCSGAARLAHRIVSEPSDA